MLNMLGYSHLDKHSTLIMLVCALHAGSTGTPAAERTFEWRGSLGQGLGAQDAVEKADGVQDPGHARVDDVEVVGHPPAHRNMQRTNSLGYGGHVHQDAQQEAETQAGTVLHSRGNSRGAALGSHLVRADLLHQVTCVDLQAGIGDEWEQ
eukprot:1159572-Pelagomonas_calceolata.AAC.3